MIKATELRIGNLINLKWTVQYGKPNSHIEAYESIVASLKEKSLCVEVAQKVQNQIKKVEYSSVTGIELTENWLLKLGFDKRRDKDDPADKPNTTYYTGWVIQDFEIYKMILENESPMWFMANGAAKKIHYVHELQNLYFALTREELAIKEKNNV